jgi:hypothetical protein
VLFSQWSWEGIADGSITVTFRRWKRPQAVTGNVYRTPAGRIEALAVDVVGPEDVTDDDARASGYPSAAALLEDLRGTRAGRSTASASASPRAPTRGPSSPPPPC